jgi:F-type H+-transporting ATPase subunit b
MIMLAPETTEGTAAPAEAGGLPQFDPTWWPGQIAWFLIIFLVVFLLMRSIFVPRIGGTIANRDATIEGDIAKARQLKDEADAQAKAAAAEIATARSSAQRVAAEARGKAAAEIAAGLAKEEAKLAETTAKAEASIAAARDKAMGGVRAIAADAAQAIVGKLTGKPATAAEIDAALPSTILAAKG